MSVWKHICTDDNVDIQERVGSVTKKGLTEAVMLWLIEQPKWKKDLDQSMSAALVKAKLNADRKERDLNVAARSIEGSLPANSTVVIVPIQELEQSELKAVEPGDTGKLYMNYVWNR